MTDVFIDTHVNLHAEQFSRDLDIVIQRARQARVLGMLAISDRLQSTDEIRKIVAQHRGLWRSVGAHPHYASEHASVCASDIAALTGEPDVIGIGECGFDFYYNHSPQADQERLFVGHIEASQETGLPLIIHTREADDEMLAHIERAMSRREFPFLLHCYTGGKRLADAAVEMGGYLSFSGIITFKNAENVRLIARSTPIDRVLIETDCPYLAPIPHRGRRNEPSFLPLVASKMAEIKGVTVSEISRLTNENFFRLFSRAGDQSILDETLETSAGQSPLGDSNG